MAIFGMGRKNIKPSQETQLPVRSAKSTQQLVSSASVPEMPPRSAMQNNFLYAGAAQQGYTSPELYSQDQQMPWQQINISNYYILPPPQPQLQSVPHSVYDQSKNRLISKSLVLLPQILESDILDLPACIPGARLCNDGLSSWHHQGTQILNQSAALYDQMSSNLNHVLTLIDGERFSGDESDLYLSHPPGPQWESTLSTDQDKTLRFAKTSKAKKDNNNTVDKGDECPIASTIIHSNYFARVNLYANSRLPVNLPPVKFYIPTFPLICLAAQYSERVYNKPSALERDTLVEADWRLGTKAMIIKSVAKDSMNVIVFAIRGSQSFLDWAVNLNSAPSSPEGFLDDAGNFCHTGFLSVARKMIKPVAAQLRLLLQENPKRCESSLLITGHSAGGAVAALLYSHMLSTSSEVSSELSFLTNFFKRIHCITFGSPPVSFLPLQKPDIRHLHKSLFLSFVNEGDLVARADKAYVRSLLDLYSSPAPKSKLSVSSTPEEVKASANTMTLNKLRPQMSKQNLSAPAVTQREMPIWKVPPSTLSNAGRLVLLRSVRRLDMSGNGTSAAGKKTKKKKPRDQMMDDGVQARSISDEMLRGVIWGDPVCHMMGLYKRRVEVLATHAVTGEM